MSNDPATITADLAEFAVRYSAAEVPAEALEQVPLAMLDLLGVTVVGASSDAGRIIRDYVSGEGASGSCVVVGNGDRRMAPTSAALANGTSGHAYDFDDIGVRAGHVSVAIMPAVLAVAEMVESSGREFATAIAVGYEVANRMTRIHDDSTAGPYAAGYHKPSTYAVFGGTAAACRLLALDPQATRRAFGIAASQAGGLRINFGTMTKPMHAGVACRTAVESAMLAARGFTSNEASIEGRFGWFDVLCAGSGDLSAITAGLGDSFAIAEGLRYKLYPSCGANHSAIDVTLELLAAHRLGRDDIARCVVSTHPHNLDVLVYEWPQTGLEGKFSLPFNVAVAIADGAVTLQSFADEVVHRVGDLRDRIQVIGDESLTRDATHVTITTRDGAVLSASAPRARGAVGSPIGWEQLVAKFGANVDAAMGADQQVTVVAQIRRLLECSSVQELTRSFSVDIDVS